MASARKKLDEKNVKILRELVSLAENKYCFDCHQRGPTYVNVTIGSFVCTSCSGMLRGITPPHRVKSISMATFTPEEIEHLKTQGNEYCRKVWLGLCDNDASVTQPKDEQQIKELMINKYERKRYYLKPEDNNSTTMNGTNGTSKPSTPMNHPKLTTSVTFPTIPSYNSVTNNNCNNNRTTTTFSSDPFTNNSRVNNSATENFNSSKFNNIDINFQSTPANFANFDNNPIFKLSTSGSLTGAINSSENGPPPPSEDRYAALKDLDCLMKSQLLSTSESATDNADKNDWSENNVVWPSSSKFEQTSEAERIQEKTLNPFAKSENGWNIPFAGNPFKTENIWNTCHTNGISTSQSMNFNSAKTVWDTSQLPNPFFVNNNGQNSSHHSSNPFL